MPGSLALLPKFGYNMLNIKLTLVTAYAFCFARTLCSTFGVDLSVPVNSTTWSCVVKETNASFASVRLYRNVGQVDLNSPNTIKAISALTPVDGYIFPCLSGSAYSLSHGIVCASAKQQVADVVEFLASEDISIKQKDQTQQKDINKVEIGKVWLDIEDELPSKYYDTDTDINQAFIAEMVSELETRGVSVGIYTTKTYWAQIMNSNPNYGIYPLWYPRYDGVNSFEFFAPFSGWDKLTIKQTAGDAPVCGLSQIDLDYAE